MVYNIDAFKDLKALVIGDLMIDEYLWGSVERISPEAPVPVVAVERENQTLGGGGQRHQQPCGHGRQGVCHRYGRHRQGRADDI